MRMRVIGEKLRVENENESSGETLRVKNESSEEKIELSFGMRLLNLQEWGSD